ncbi:hypothetical protein ABPG75_008640 [Micractinium tetrahymenae]
MRGRVMPRSASAECLLAPAAAAAAPPTGPPLAQAPRRQGLTLRLRGYGLGLRVPSEMWGATALALRLAQPPAGAAAAVLPQLHRSASVIAQAFSSAAAAPPPTGPVSEDHPKALAAALEWRPQLGAAEDWACLLGSATVCTVVYALTAPATVQPLYAACMGLLYLLLVAASRTWLVERQYRAIQRSEQELAGSDSRFLAVHGIQLHYKRRTPAVLPAGVAGAAGAAGGVLAMAGAAAGRVVGAAAAVGPAEDRPTVVHCLHGFGASCYSWSFVQQELADALQASVTAHDMPGFGLSQRPRSPKYYTLHFNGDAARAIMVAELSGQLAQHDKRSEWRQQQQQQWGEKQQQWGEKGGGGASQAGLGEWRSHPLGSGGLSRGSSAASLADWADEEAQRAQRAQQPRRICIGHSMGGAAAAEGVIANPEGVAALVLVAPAIVALWMGPPEEAADDRVTSGLSVVEEFVSAEDDPGELQRLSSYPSSSGSSGGGGSSPLLPRSDSASSTASGSTRRGRAAAAGGAGARLRRAARGAAAVAKAAVMLLVRLALLAATPLLVLLLRRLVRARRFWERGLASAWHDSRKVTQEYVDAYRSGQLVRGWEGGLLRFLSARFAEKHGFWHSVREAIQVGACFSLCLFQSCCEKPGSRHTLHPPQPCPPPVPDHPSLDALACRERATSPRQSAWPAPSGATTSECSSSTEPATRSSPPPTRAAWRRCCPTQSWSSLRAVATCPKRSARSSL